MSTFYNIEDDGFPVMIEHISDEWDQDPIIRHQGYPHFHWLQTVAGEGKFMVANKTFTLAPGQGILVSAGVPHRYEQTSDQRWVVQFATFQGQFAEEMSEYAMNAKYILVSDSETANVSDMLGEMIAEIESGQQDMLKLSTLSYGMLLTLASYRQRQLEVRHPDYDNYLKPTIAYMEAHYGEPIKISDLAAAVHVSPQYLSRTFKRFINQSPGQYLLGLRINRAKTLLVSQKHLMISAVADAVGIPDQAYFSNVFKRETGVTPLNYRKWQH